MVFECERVRHGDWMGGNGSGLYWIDGMGGKLVWDFVDVAIQSICTDLFCEVFWISMCDLQGQE